MQRPPTSTPHYTHNWVSFEVGVAAAYRKPIWVFEEFSSLVRFPVPYVTDYAQYTLQNLDHLQYYGSLFQDRIIQGTNRFAPVQRLPCEYTDCNAIYNCWSVAETFNCPVCRRRIPKTSGALTPPIAFPSNVV